MQIKPEHNFTYKKSSATCFCYKSHLQAQHIFTVCNTYRNSTTYVMDEIWSYIKMEVLYNVMCIKNGV